MLRSLVKLGTLAAGVGLVYLFDPNAGRRRRALLRDQLTSGLRHWQIALDKTLRDTRQRAQGFAAEMRGALQPREVSDNVLTERVRSKMGRYVSHPSAIHVDAREGNVALTGPILDDEVEPFVAAIRRLPGVRSVENALEVHHDRGNISALQGGTTPPGEHWNIVEQNWAPATRLGAAVAGGLLIAYGMSRRFPVACALGAAGMGLCAAALGARNGENAQPFRHRQVRQGTAAGEKTSREFARNR